MSEAKKIGWNLLGEDVKQKIETGSPDGGVSVEDFESLSLDSYEHFNDVSKHLSSAHSIIRTNNLKEIVQNGTYLCMLLDSNAENDYPSDIFGSTFSSFLTVDSFEYWDSNAGKFSVTQKLWDIANGNCYIRQKNNQGNWSSWTFVGLHFFSSYRYLYVDPINGVDSPDYGDSSDRAYKTVLYALQSIPTNVVGGVININLLSGDHPGFHYNPQQNNFLKCKVVIQAQSGATVRATGSWQIRNIKDLTVKGINFVAIATFYHSDNLLVENCSGAGGVYFSECIYVRVSTCDFSGNTSSAITVFYVANCVLESVIGTGNKTGIYCGYSVVRKASNSTITGTTPQTLYGGSQILT